MTARLLDGTATAASIKSDLAMRVTALRDKGITPGLATVLVGTDPGSQWYVGGKHKDCAEVGIASIRRDLPESATQAEVEAVIDELNANPEVTGYIVQLPLPAHIDTDAILERIDPDKDADGLHPMNLGRLVNRASGPIESPLPCTPRGVIELVEHATEAANGVVNARLTPVWNLLFGFGHGHGNRHALAGGKAIGLDHHRGAEFRQRR